MNQQNSTKDKGQILAMNAYDPAVDGSHSSPLLARHAQNSGAASVLFYQKPLELVSAKGCWMTDKDGVSYLDFYNNVPSVGHSHPEVVDAISAQLGKLNINSRYLCEGTESYLERLKNTFPSSLQNIVLTCSGSEANDLALRIARKNAEATGIIVTATAYHGNTAITTEISPAAFFNGNCPEHIAVVPEPSRAVYGDDIRTGFLQAVFQAIEKLQASGHGFAGFICDSIFSSDGVLAEPKGFLKPVIDLVHAAGGYYIADEVQPGFARTGEAFWGYARHGIEPDIVSMGKPMGNGYPIAGIAVRPDLLDRFCADVGYFNTFGGTPAAAAAGMAVLEVIETEDLQANALATGNYLQTQLRNLAESSEFIGDVRGSGLFIGVDISADDKNTPAPELASQLINALRDERVLIGAAGAYGHTLKIRPPMCLNQSEADFFLTALEKASRTLTA